jgi:phosphate transport system permease protein
VSLVTEADGQAAAAVVSQQFPQGPAAAKHDRKRSRRGVLFRLLFLTSLVVAVLSLLTLLYTVVNQSFGFVAIESTIKPEEVISGLGLPPGTQLPDLDTDKLVAILAEHISRNAGRRLEREQRFFDDHLAFEPQDSWDALCAGPDPTPGCRLPARDRAGIYQLVLERVVEPNVVATWSLTESVFERSSILYEVVQDFPEAQLELRSGVSASFVG